MRNKLLVFFVMLAMISFASAAGFGLYEFGARSSAMGGAVVANPYDASTLFYNPSGLAFVSGMQFYANIDLIFPKALYVGPEPYPWAGEVYNAESQVFTPIGLFFTYPINERVFTGISVTNPFGLGLKWSNDFPGRFVARNTDLKSFYISPVVAYKVNDNFSLGFGLDLVIAQVLLERNVLLFDNRYEVGTSKLTGTSKLGIGFTASLTYKTDRFGFGAMYRHNVKNQFQNGKAEFTIFDDLSVPNVAVLARSILKDQNVNTAITFPGSFTVGVYYRLMERLGVEVDYNYVMWSVFDKLEIEFPDDPRLNQTVNENYQNSYTIRFGAHYDLSENFSLLGGFILDKTPQPIESVSPLLPDNDRTNFSAGFSYRSGKMQFDAGYMFVNIGERSTIENGVGQNDVGFDGVYNSNASLFFVSFGYTIK